MSEIEPGFKSCPFCAEPIRKEATVCRYCNRAMPAGSHSPNATICGLPQRLIIFAAIVICGLCFYLIYRSAVNTRNLAARHGFSPSSFTSVQEAPRFAPVRKALALGNFVVQPRRTSYWQFTVDPSTMTDVRVVGEFHTFGGSGNDIIAILAAPDQFENLINGHMGRTFYDSQKTTNGEINVGPLPPGPYVFGFSNAFSTISSKEVTADVELRYLAKAQ